MKKINIEAELMPVSVAFAAKAGDNLMVVNGVCIGVMQAKKSAADAKPATGEFALGDLPVSERMERVYTALKKKPMSSYGLGNFFDAQTQADRAKITYVVGVLTTAKRIVRDPTLTEAGQPIYKVKKGA